MGVAGLVGGAASAGQMGAQNGTSFGPDWAHSLLNKSDPIGRTIVDKGGDPWNLYGEQNNPNAAFFPSSNNANGTSGPLPNGPLPNLGINMPIAPGQGTWGVAPGNGIFNQMASQGAGNIYTPTAASYGSKPALTAPLKSNQNPNIGIGQNNRGYLPGGPNRGYLPGGNNRGYLEQ